MDNDSDEAMGEDEGFEELGAVSSLLQEDQALSLSDYTGCLSVCSYAEMPNISVQPIVYREEGDDHK
jgi:hypothetical protein